MFFCPASKGSATMRLSSKGRYGTRAMVDLALNGNRGPVSSKDIAERQEVSRGYLEQILLRLAARNLVRPIRGRAGGFVLAKSPSRITAAEIIEALEGPFNLVDCTEDPACCNRSPFCATRDVWAGVSRAIDDHLSGITLADMADRQRDLEQVNATTYSI